MSDVTNKKPSKIELFTTVIFVVIQSFECISFLFLIVSGIRGPEKTARDAQKLKCITRAATREGTILGNIIIAVRDFCGKKFPFLTK